MSAAAALARLEQWFDTMRGSDGYGGPVVHWWRDCLVFCGAAADWRYEGIITAYAALFTRTGELHWLAKAKNAGDDVVRSQMPNGNFRHSGFEQNPYCAGTPHEAAADCGLLRLADVLRRDDDSSWSVYLNAACRNLTDFYIARLWSPTEQRFRDDPSRSSFVPNKSATLIEALCLLADVTQRGDLLEQYVRPTADAILAHQIRAPGSPFDGGIAQNTLGQVRVEKYFPYYISRCVPGLLAAYRRLGDDRYLDAARRALGFVDRWRDADGGFPQVIYGNGRVNRYPRWVAAAGDVLRAAALLQPYGFDFPAQPTLDWMLARQLPSGAFAAAEGFGARAVQQLAQSRPEWRDLMPVCGWNDKAFRYLAEHGAPPADSRQPPSPYERACMVDKRPAQLHEDNEAIELRCERRLAYRWQKGSTWAQVRGARRARRCRWKT